MQLLYKKEIEKELQSFFEKKKNDKDILSLEITEAVELLEDFSIRGGKRIRAMLMIIAYLGYGGKNKTEIIKASISIELLQSFLLIHDDIIDNDDMRRGGPTVHAYYKKKHPKKYSESLALVIGDFAFTYSLEPLLHSDFPNKIQLRAIKEFTSVTKVTCYGQILDLFSSIHEIDEDFTTQIHINKTAVYTILGPLRLGAIFAGVSEEKMKPLNAFALNLGRAFQIKDDILGIFGDEKKLGKSMASDLIEGKKTLLVLKANSSYINKKIGNNLTKKEIEKIKEIMIKSGSLEYSENLLNDLLDKAKINLKNLDIREEEKEFLYNLLEYIGDRKV
ncbi:MAG: polyprenyl synthetase family protein [Candidatus Magasanikbacteria bacterium]|jgi:geranylgeranyl diphosphate synthase, type I|nr:polyprenyl synthetase family protein [Candidatus Magasanikbacteria bacterium]MBT4071796.1 polyprenyl synthetase family protein [Candidatus Magasanikbacteria bacterium]